jgi:hypothetical protein
VPFEAALSGVAEPPLYQRIAGKVLHLHRLGFNKRCIGKHIDVDDKTVAKTIRWIYGLKS